MQSNINLQKDLGFLKSGVDVEKFAEQVRASGVGAELHVYPDAPHSFFDRTFAEHADACDDAWRRILDFVERHRQH